MHVLDSQTTEESIGLSQPAKARLRTTSADVRHYVLLSTLHHGGTAFVPVRPSIARGDADSVISHRRTTAALLRMSSTANPQSLPQPRGTRISHQPTLVAHQSSPSCIHSPTHTGARHVTTGTTTLAALTISSAQSYLSSRTCQAPFAVSLPISDSALLLPPLSHLHYNALFCSCAEQRRGSVIPL